MSKKKSNPDHEPDEPVVTYFCNKCKRKVEFIMYAGMPLKVLPCGGKCEGQLILQE